jgi:hypothetical protein
VASLLSRVFARLHDQAIHTGSRRWSDSRTGCASFGDGLRHRVRRPTVGRSVHSRSGRISHFGAGRIAYPDRWTYGGLRRYRGRHRRKIRLERLVLVGMMAGILLLLMGLTGLGTAVKYIPRPVTIGLPMTSH